MLEWLFGKKREEAPAPPKPSAQQQAEDKWKYDFLVQFLSGPLWKTSILDFVDYNCVVFDNEEENKFEYTVIHNKFKELVGSLFDSMVQEVGLDDDKLAELLEKGFESKQKKIFNQLLLADDFLRFKSLMLNRNKALEAEALKALQKSQAPEPRKQKSREEDVLRESQRAEEQRRRLQFEEEEQLRKILEMSRLEAQEKEAFSRLEQKAAENELRHSQLAKQSPPSPPKPVQKEAPKVEAVKEQPKVPVNEQPTVLPPVRRRKKVEESPKVETKVEQKVEQVEPKVQPKVEPFPVEQKPEPVVEQTEVQSQEQRKRRLLQQRQKIRRKKQEERKKQAAQEELRGSQVQTIVLQEDGIHETQLHAPEEEKKEKVNNEQIERRRQLMRKIKNRIVDDF